jgi:predicted DNA-binding protein YlxM (UPF0122 family)
MGKGINVKTGRKAIEQAQRRAEILRLRLDGLTLEEIGNHMGIARDAVHNIISRALNNLTKKPAEDLLAMELARCEELMTQALQTVRAFHPLIANGKVVYAPVLDDEGQPMRDPATGDVLTTVLEDKAPKLAAIATCVRVLDRRSKYLGLDAPVRAQTDLTVSAQSNAPDLSHLSLNDLEALRHMLYGGRNPVVNQDNQLPALEVLQ